jgi:hypothetical protein
MKVIRWQSVCHLWSVMMREVSKESDLVPMSRLPRCDQKAGWIGAATKVDVNAKSMSYRSVIKTISTRAR